MTTPATWNAPPTVYPLSPSDRARLDAAGWVMLDIEAITDAEHDRLRGVAARGWYGPDDAALVVRALASYDDAHGVSQ